MNGIIWQIQVLTLFVLLKFSEEEPLKVSCYSSSLGRRQVKDKAMHCHTFVSKAKEQMATITCRYFCSFAVRLSRAMTRIKEGRMSSTGLVLRSTYPSAMQPGKKTTLMPCYNYIFCLLKAGFLWSDKHLCITNWAHIISTHPPNLWLQNTYSEYHKLFTNSAPFNCVAHPSLQKDSSLLLTYIAWAYSSAQLSSKIRRDGKTNTMWQFVLIFDVKHIFPSMSTSLWI